MKRLVLTAAFLVSSCSGKTEISATRSTGGDAGPTGVGGGGRGSSTDASAIDAGTNPLALKETECPPPAPPTFPCQTPCGNGVVDSCEWPWGTLLEDCDGSIPPDNPGLNPSCASRGYAGGTMACSSYCMFDYSGCTSCVANPEVVQCLERLGPRVVRGAAAGLGRIGFAHYPAEGILRFDQLDQSFAPVVDGRCWELGGLGLGTQSDWTIARLASGWLLATSTATGTVVLQLADGGLAVGPARSWSNLTGSRMISRESEGPLMLLRAQDNSAHGVLFDGAGEVTWDKPLAFNHPIANCREPVFTRDGFLMVRVEGDSSVAVEKFDLDGRLVAAHPIDTGCPGTTGLCGCPMLAWNGAEARMVWTAQVATAGPVRWLRLDADGAQIGTPSTVLDSPTGFKLPAPVAVAAGRDTLVIFDDFSAARVDDTGALSVPPFAFRKLPERMTMFQHATFELDTDVVVLSQDLHDGIGAGLTRFRR